MSWFYLILGIILEVSGTTCMKLSQGFTHLWPSVLMFILYGLGFTSVNLAFAKIDVSIGYAVWSGVGTILIASVGIVWFKEPISALKIISLGLIIVGVIGLKFGGEAH